MTETKTLGEQRVRTSFNPNSDSLVDQIKRKTAELIDLCNQCGSDEIDRDMECRRLVVLAQTNYEQAAMWAVKAATT